MKLGKAVTEAAYMWGKEAKSRRSIAASKCICDKKCSKIRTRDGTDRQEGNRMKGIYQKEKRTSSWSWKEGTGMGMQFAMTRQTRPRQRLRWKKGLSMCTRQVYSKHWNQSQKERKQRGVW
jgi:hypothetical protein